MISYSHISEKKKLSFEEVDLEKAAIYSGEDVYMTHKLYKEQQNDLYITNSSVLDGMELPLMKVLSDMETS
jgi:DNA polymerase I-like protein with 3'-5' exonuclease and polymerase domains